MHAPSLEYALELAEAFAPEHLELLGPLAEQLAPRVTRAGCVFVGTGTAFGDYIAGLQPHAADQRRRALRLGAWARSTSAASSPRSGSPTATALARAAAPIARAEGFELHAQSMEIRIRENQS